MLAIKVEEHAKVIVIQIIGDFFIESLKTVEQVWQEQVDKRPNIIALDCTRLDHLDSAAIGSLVKFFNQAMELKIKLVFCDVNSALLRLFETARFRKFFTVTSRKRFESKYLCVR